MNALWPGIGAGNLVKDVWLSEAIARPCYRLDLAGSAAAGSTIPTDLAELVLIDARVPVDRTDLVGDLEDAGFHLIDTGLTLSRPARHGGELSDQVRFAMPEDRAAVEAIAGSSFSWSRLHRDPRIPTETANRVKALWAGNFFDGGRGDHMVVATARGTVVGFLLVIAASADEMVIDLIAVDQDYRGRGLARAMTTFAESNCGQPRVVKVCTQLTNSQSLQLYFGNGFRWLYAHYVLHYHGQPNGRISS